MTLRRQPLYIRALPAALALALALYAPVGLADSAPKPATAPGKAADRAWLRTQTPKAATAAAPASGSSLRVLGVGLLVVTLGGAALMLRRRRGSVARAVRSDLQIVSAARLSPKAQVVVISVGGRKLLLGVTDSGVSRLAVLDGELDAELPEPESSPLAKLGALETSPSFNRALVPPAQVPARAPVTVPTTRSFKDLLLGALRPEVRPEPAPLNVAATIAESTHDVVTRSAESRIAAPHGAPDMVDVEGQARGLVLRLQKRA